MNLQSWIKKTHGRAVSQQRKQELFTHWCSGYAAWAPSGAQEQLHLSLLLRLRSFSFAASPARLGRIQTSLILLSLLRTFELITDSYSVSGTNQARKVRIESVVREASDSDFVIFDDVRKTKNLSSKHEIKDAFLYHRVSARRLFIRNWLFFCKNGCV